MLIYKHLQFSVYIIIVLIILSVIVGNRIDRIEYAR